MHRKMEREFPREQGPGPQLLPQWRGNEKTLAQQEGGCQNQGYPSWILQIAGCGLKGVKISIDSMLSSVFSKICPLQACDYWGVQILFLLVGRQVSAHSTLPTSRLLNYYFPGSKRDRSQLIRPAPFVKVGSKALGLAKLPLQRFLWTCPL